MMKKNYFASPFIQLLSNIYLFFFVCFSQEADSITLEANIRWAEAFILTYSVTDKCSFDECNRLKFLINYNKRRRRLGSNHKVN